jgi:hypothetical protein
MSSYIKNKSSGMYSLSVNDKMPAADFDEINYNDKVKIECICPKCEQIHKMNIHWMGRGTPRKYCTTCKAGN